MDELYIQLNNRLYPYVDGATIGSLMAENNFDFAAIIVKINGAVIEEDDWLTAAVNAGDNVEIIHIFGGG
jgi:thiamine biosynthesis protein ThiS